MRVVRIGSFARKGVIVVIQSPLVDVVDSTVVITHRPLRIRSLTVAMVVGVCWRSVLGIYICIYASKAVLSLYVKMSLEFRGRKKNSLKNFEKIEKDKNPEKNFKREFSSILCHFVSSYIHIDKALLI